ncbi:MAG TPA: ABC transporter permease, partial [Chthonomonadales bacterium]|nr:ABC transporter permease [Chthonomonadales bacterium]
MSLLYSLRTALNNLRVNKLRSALTMLGVIIGVSAVIMMVAILQGASSRVTKEFEKLGSNLILVIYQPDENDKKATTRRIDGLTMDDVRAIQRECDLVGPLSPEQSLGTTPAMYEGNHTVSRPIGVEPQYEQLRNVQVAHGRFISSVDLDTWAKVCVVGPEIVTKLMKGREPIGADIKVEGVDLTVVGVLAPKGRTFDGDADQIIYIPLSTVHKRFLG